MKKTAAALAAILIFLCLAACSPYRTGDTTSVMVVGGQVIRAELYTYVFYKNRDLFFGADRAVADLTDAERARLDEAVEWELKRYAAVFDAADRYGVALTKEDKERAAQNLEDVKSEYDEDVFYKELERRHMSENVFYEQCLNLVLDDELYRVRAAEISASLSGEKLRREIDENCYAAVQILWTGKNAVQALERVAGNIRSAEDFYAAVAKYSVDTVRDVRVCIVGEMLEPFEKAALALSPGEISPVVESSVGAHIILRVALTDDLIEQNLDDLRKKVVVRLYREELNTFARDEKVEYTKGFKGLKLL